jgi:hypothetical protein
VPWRAAAALLRVREMESGKAREGGSAVEKRGAVVAGHSRENAEFAHELFFFLRSMKRTNHSRTKRDPSEIQHACKGVASFLAR